MCEVRLTVHGQRTLLSPSLPPFNSPSPVSKCFIAPLPAAVYPNGPDVFVAFKLNKGCGASGNDPCAMRFR